MAKWSDWILLEGCLPPPKGSCVQYGNPSRFRVPIGDDGWSDWIDWSGGECPVPGQQASPANEDLAHWFMNGALWAEATLRAKNGGAA